MAKITQEQIYSVTSKLVVMDDIISYNGNFYRYNNWIWKLIDHSGDIEATIFNSFIDSKLPIPANQNINEVKTLLKPITYNEYKKSIIAKSDSLKRNWDIYLNDNILNLKTMKNKQYEKEDFVFQNLPYNFIHDDEQRREFIQKNTIWFKSFLTSVFLDDKYLQPDWKYTEEWLLETQNIIKFVQEWMWYSLLPFNPLEKALIMVWEWRNWKWVLTNIWKEVIGKDNYTTLTLEEINDPWYLWLTKNKLINFSDDLNSNIQLDTWVVKGSASNEEVSSNQKFKDQDRFFFTSKLVMSCNELPYLKKVWPAVKERFQILTFPNIFTQDKWNLNINLKHELKEESEWIFNWAVEWLIRLHQNQQFTMPNWVKDDINSYMEDYDIVSLWIKEDEDIVTNDLLWMDSPKKLYWIFSLFAQSSWKQVMSKPKFYKKLETLWYLKVKIEGYEYFRWIKIKKEQSWLNNK